MDIIYILLGLIVWWFITLFLSIVAISYEKKGKTISNMVVWSIIVIMLMILWILISSLFRLICINYLM